jgi:hypothetical protein
LKNNQRDTLWQDWQLAHPKESAVLARVMEQKHHQYICEILNTGEQVKAKVTPKLREAAGGEEDFPVVGDWVALDITKELDRDLKAVLGILPRQGALRRAAAGLETRQQILSANLDYLLLVFWPRRRTEFCSGHVRTEPYYRLGLRCKAPHCFKQSRLRY